MKLSDESSQPKSQWFRCNYSLVQELIFINLNKSIQNVQQKIQHNLKILGEGND
jgi:hypothetical protein